MPFPPPPYSSSSSSCIRRAKFAFGREIKMSATKNGDPRVAYISDSIRAIPDFPHKGRLPPLSCHPPKLKKSRLLAQSFEVLFLPTSGFGFCLKNVSCFPYVQIEVSEHLLFNNLLGSSQYYLWRYSSRNSSRQAFTGRN